MILLFCGPPASGKTTIIKELVKNLKNYFIISSDEFKRRTYQRLFQKAKENISKYDYLILNGTFYKREHRDKFCSLGKNLKIIYVDASLENCLKRNEKRRDRIDKRGVITLHKKFERGKTNVYLNTNHLQPKEAAKKIIDLLYLK